jgi:hypothetical protein
MSMVVTRTSSGIFVAEFDELRSVRTNDHDVGLLDTAANELLYHTEGCLSLFGIPPGCSNLFAIGTWNIDEHGDDVVCWRSLESSTICNKGCLDPLSVGVVARVPTL